MQSCIFFIGVELIHKSSYSQPFHELPFFYYKRVITATHSFKFTVFLQNKNWSKEILTIIAIPPWFQACIYWKKSWRHHFHPFIFFYDSVIISREHLKKSTWQGNCVYLIKRFATIHYNKRFVVDSRKSWRVCLFQKSHCALALLKVPIYFAELVAIIFCFLKSTVLNVQKYLQRSHYFMVNQLSEIHFFKNFKTKCGV